MPSRLKKFKEYLKETASNCQKLVAQNPKQEAVILQYVARQPTAQKEIESPFELAELFYERACILSSDMNLPFEWAEAVVKFRSIERPQVITQSSWLEIKAVCDQLYMNDFALLKLIINNGWAVEDIYGCNKPAPLVRVDCMGLLLLLRQGDEVVSVNKERIKILRRSGKVNYLRKRLDPQLKVGMLYEL